MPSTLHNSDSGLFFYKAGRASYLCCIWLDISCDKIIFNFPMRHVHDNSPFQFSTWTGLSSNPTLTCLRSLKKNQRQSIRRQRWQEIDAVVELNGIFILNWTRTSWPGGAAFTDWLQGWLHWTDISLIFFFNLSSSLTLEISPGFKQVTFPDHRHPHSNWSADFMEVLYVPLVDGG